MDLQSHRALVTGGAVRIGRAICRALAASGCDVAIHYWRSRKEAHDLARELREYGRQTWVIGGCLSSESGCRRLFDRAWNETGGFDILVNNAAVFHRDNLLETDAKKMWAELQINLVAPMMLTRFLARQIIRSVRCAARFAPDTRSQGTPVRPLRACVVNLLDRRITGNETGCFAYLLSKKMLASAMMNAALELSPFLRINAVAPGAILPPLPGKGNRPKERAGRVPLGIQCTPEDVARAVIFLLEADAVTGQIIFVDGGQHLLGNIEQT